MKQDDFCCGHSLHLPHSTFQIRAKSLQAFPRYATSKIGLVSWLFFFFLFFFLFSHTYKNCYKMRTLYPIALKFGSQKGGIKAHLCTNFGWNTIKRKSVMIDYSRKITSERINVLMIKTKYTLQAYRGLDTGVPCADGSVQEPWQDLH